MLDLTSFYIYVSYLVDSISQGINLA